MSLVLSPTSLRARLMLLVLLAIIPAAGLLLYGLGEHRGIAAQKAREDALRAVRIAAASHERLIEGARQMLLLLAQLPDIRTKDSGACSAFLAGILARYPQYANLGVIRLDGSVQCSALPMPTTVNAADRAYFRRALESRDFAVGEYQIGRITGKATVNFGQPVIDSAGAATAVVFAALDLGWLAEYGAQLALPRDAALSLVDRNGVVLVHHPEPAKWTGRALAEAPLVQALREQRAAGTIEAAGFDGVVRFYGFAPLESGADLGVVLNVGIPRSEVYAEVDRMYLGALLALGSVALLTFGMAWVGSSVFVLQQVRALLRATKRLAMGDLGARSGVPRGRGELNQLAGAFDEMGEALQQREREARRSADEIRLLQSLTMAVSTAPDLHSALATALRMMCEATQWSLAQAWVPTPDGKRLALTPGWHGSEAALAAFHDYSAAFRFERGEGLPGRAWASREPVWIPDVRSDPSLLRVLLARELGIQTGMAVPVLAGDEVVAVVEFFLIEARQPDERVLKLAAGVAAQLGAVIQKKRAEDRVRHLAYFDRLTDLPNRTKLDELIAAEIERARPFAVVAITLHRFAEVNYTLGQSYGDRLLKEIGPRLAAGLREDDTVAHFGGRNFALLLPGRDAETALEPARRILHDLEEPFQLDGLTVELEAHMGIALYPEHGDSAGVLMRRADVALYAAQQSGRDYEVYGPDRDPYSPRRLSLMGELRRALAGGQFVLYCQPKVELKTGRVIAVETLVRWEHPAYGRVPPDEFIPLIESSGLIQPLTQWVLDAALAQCRAWEEAGIRVPAAVNLSTRNLLDPELVDRVRRALGAWNAPADWLEFEITESLVMADPEASLACLQRLRANGHKLAIDDYGKGYASLSYLRNLPVDAIKIDQEFVMGLAQDAADALMVRSTIEVAHHLGRKVIAEGVESREIWARLVALECDEGQGYFIARPLPASGFAEWLARWSAPSMLAAAAERTAS